MKNAQLNSLFYDATFSNDNKIDLTNKNSNFNGQKVGNQRDLLQRNEQNAA